MTDASPVIFTCWPGWTALYANQTVLDTPVSLGGRAARDSAHGSSTLRIGTAARGAPGRRSRAVSLLNLSNERLEKTVTIAGFLSATIPSRRPRHIIRWYATGTDIEDRKRAEERMRDENLALREQIDHAFMFEEIVGSSPALQTVLSSIVKVAPTDSTVLITGETGTGKELIARAIHKHSRRSGQAFISVNCASIPSSLIASELFGHEKGAFTGAVQRRQRPL